MCGVQLSRVAALLRGRWSPAGNARRRAMPCLRFSHHLLRSLLPSRNVNEPLPFSAQALARPGLLNAVLAAPTPLQWVLGIFVAVATLLYWEQFRFRAARWG